MNDHTTTNAADVSRVDYQTPCYAFQYFANGKMIEDTGLITKGEALDLFQKYEQHFIDNCQGRNDGEMAIWEDMADESDYRKTMKHIHSTDVVIKNGMAYTLEPVFK